MGKSRAQRGAEKRWGSKRERTRKLKARARILGQKTKRSYTKSEANKINRQFREHMIRERTYHVTQPDGRDSVLPDAANTVDVVMN